MNNPLPTFIVFTSLLHGNTSQQTHANTDVATSDVQRRQEQLAAYFHDQGVVRHVATQPISAT